MEPLCHRGECAFWLSVRKPTAGECRKCQGLPPISVVELFKPERRETWYALADGAASPARGAPSAGGG